MGAFSEDFLSEDDFEAVLATFCCYDYGANSSEAVEKIATDQKDYHKSSLGVITNIVSINNNKESWLLGHLQRS